MIPPTSEPASPPTNNTKAFNQEYSSFYFSKLRTKKTGKNEETAILPKFLRNVAIKMYLEVGRPKITLT